MIELLTSVGPRLHCHSSACFRRTRTWAWARTWTQSTGVWDNFCLSESSSKLQDEVQLDIDLMLLQRVCLVFVTDSFVASGCADTILPQPPDFLLVLFDDSFVVLARQDWSACWT